MTVADLPEADTKCRLVDARSERSCWVEKSENPELLLGSPEDATLRTPEVDAPMTLYWAGERGQYQLPIVFLRPEQNEHLRLLRVRADGPVELSQRRRYVRVPADLPIQLSAIGIAGSRDGKLIDISEGGARCRFPSAYVDEGDRVELDLDLDGEVFIQGSVLRVTPDLDGCVMIFVFDLDETWAGPIRRYVFAQQMAERRLRSR